jgi:hypothetical protein
LWDAVFRQGEVGGLETVRWIAVRVGDDDVEDDEAGGDVEGGDWESGGFWDGSVALTWGTQSRTAVGLAGGEARRRATE